MKTRDEELGGELKAFTAGFKEEIFKIIATRVKDEKNQQLISCKTE